MSRASVTADFFKTLDILLDDMAELTFDTVFFLDHVTETIGIFGHEILGTSVRIDRKLLQNFLTRRKTDTKNVCQGYFNALIIWNVDTGDTYHISFSSF